MAVNSFIGLLQIPSFTDSVSIQIQAVDGNIFKYNGATYTPGDTFLRCNVHGMSPGSYTWYKNGVEIASTTTDGILDGTESEITITAAEAFSAADVASYKVVIDGDNSLSDSISLLKLVDGSEGLPSTFYYILAPNGTALLEGDGTIDLRVHRVTGEEDVELTSGDVKLYKKIDDNFVTLGAGQEYSATLDADDINSSLIVYLVDVVADPDKIFDTITLVDISDGYGFVGSVNTSTGLVMRVNQFGIESPDELILTPKFYFNGTDVTSSPNCSISLDPTPLPTGVTADASGVVTATDEWNGPLLKLTWTGEYTHQPGGRSTPSILRFIVAETIYKVYDGMDGEASIQYYIKTPNGTTIKDGAGDLITTAFRNGDGSDVPISSGDIKLMEYDTRFIVTPVPSAPTGRTVEIRFKELSTGTGDSYNHTFDASDINRNKTVYLVDTTKAPFYEEPPNGIDAYSGVWDTVNLADIGDPGGIVCYATAQADYGSPGNAIWGSWNFIIHDKLSRSPNLSAFISPVIYFNGTALDLFSDPNLTVTFTIEKGTIGTYTDWGNGFIIIDDLDSVTSGTTFKWAISYNYSPGNRNPINYTFDLIEQILILEDGSDGVDTEKYYIKPLSGTVIKDGLGSIDIEARRLYSGSDDRSPSNLSVLKKKVGEAYVDLDNYTTVDSKITATISPDEINGNLTIYLLDPTETIIYDTITLADITDGNTLVSFIESDNGLVFSIDQDNIASPSDITLTPKFYFNSIDVSSQCDIIISNQGSLPAGFTVNADKSVTVDPDVWANDLQEIRWHGEYDHQYGSRGATQLIHYESNISETIYKTKDGVSSYAVSLTNYNTLIHYDEDGARIDNNPIETYINVYRNNSIVNELFAFSEAHIHTSHNDAITLTDNHCVVNPANMENESDVITLTATKTTDPSITFDIEWHIQKTHDGINAKYIKIEASDYIFKYPKKGSNSNSTPSSIVLDANVYNFTETSVQWYYKTPLSSIWNTLANGGVNQDELQTTISPTETYWGTNKSLTFKCIVNATYEDSVTIAKVYDGSGYTFLLSNESEAVPCDSDGTPQETTFTSSLIAYYNGTQLTYSTDTTPDDAHFYAVVDDFEACEASISGGILTVTNITNDIAYVDVKFVVDYGDIEAIKRMTLKKVYDGKDSVNSFKSIVFVRNNSEPDPPSGGSYSTPVPVGWEDGIPAGTAILWSSSRVFSEDGNPPQTASWSAPSQLTDTKYVEYMFSESTSSNPGYPGNPQNGAVWLDDATEDTIWMAIQKIENGVTSAWEVVKIKGEQGISGNDARTVKLNAEKYAIAYNAGGTTPDPVSQVLTATAAGTQGTVYYEFLLGAASQQNTTNNTWTYSSPANYSSTPKTIQVKIREGSAGGTVVATDTITIYAIKEYLNGKDAITGFLTNESHVVAADFNGNNFSLADAGGYFYLYNGITPVDAETITFSSSQTKNNLTITISGATGQYTLSGGTWNTNSEYFDLTATYNGVTITKRYSISKAKAGLDGSDGIDGADGADGADGIDARVVNLTTTKQVFDYFPDGSLDGSSNATITATALNTSGTVYYEFFKNDASQGSPSTTATYSYSAQADNTNMPDKIEVQIREGNITEPTSGILARDQITIYGAQKGADAPTIVLSNEAHSLPTTNTGIVTYDNSGTDINVWLGNTRLPYDDTVTYASPSFRVSAAGTYVTPNASPSTVSTFTRRYGVCSNMTQNTATITFTITVRDKSGNDTVYTRVQSLSKSIEGEDGVDGLPAKALTISADGYVFKYPNSSIRSVPTPSTITITAYPINLNSPTYTWQYKDGASWPPLSGTASIKTINYSDDIFDSNGVATVRCTATDGSAYYDTVTITKLSAGSGYTAIVTNESHTVTATSDGTCLDLANATSDLYMYLNTTQLPRDPGVTTAATLDEYDVAIITQSGCTASLSPITINSKAAARLTVDTFTSNSGYIDVRFYTDLGDIQETRRITLSKSKQAPSFLAIYSPTENGTYTEGFEDGDKWMKTSNDGGATYGNPVQIVGENGKDALHIFQRAINRPDTPIGNMPVVGWEDGPPEENGKPLWMAKGDYDPVTNTTNWEDPVHIDGDSSTRPSDVNLQVFYDFNDIKTQPDNEAIPVPNKRIIDKSKNRNHATPVMPLASKASPSGFAYKHIDKDNEILINSTAKDFGIINSFSTSIWFRIDNLNKIETKQGIASFQNGTYSGWRLGVTNLGAISFWSDENGGVGEVHTADSVIIAGQYHNIALSYNGTKVIITVDGIVHSEENITIIAGSGYLKIADQIYDPARNKELGYKYVYQRADPANPPATPVGSYPEDTSSWSTSIPENNGLPLYYSRIGWDNAPSGRVSSGLVSFLEFFEGVGTNVSDTGGSGTNLEISSDYQDGTPGTPTGVVSGEWTTPNTASQPMYIAEYKLWSRALEYEELKGCHRQLGISNGSVIPGEQITLGAITSTRWSYTNDSSFIGTMFDLDNDKLYTSDGVFSGKITSSLGSIGGWGIDATSLSKNVNDYKIGVISGTYPRFEVSYTLDGGNYLEIGRISRGPNKDKFGIQYYYGGEVAREYFVLTSDTRRIAGFEFDEKGLYGSSSLQSVIATSQLSKRIELSGINNSINFINGTTTMSLSNSDLLNYIELSSSQIIFGFKLAGIVLNNSGEIRAYNPSGYGLSIINTDNLKTKIDSNVTIALQVGSADKLTIDSSGYIKPSGGYKSVDGTTGWSGTFLDSQGNTITVKNGLITSKLVN